MVTDKYGEPVTEERWRQVEFAINSFVRKYPLHWDVWKKDVHENKSEWNVATEGDLAKSNFRNSASFPVVYRRKKVLTDADKYAEDDLEQVDSLYETLIFLLPGLVDKDHDGKPNKLFREFLKRFPVFVPSEKMNV